MKDNWCSAFSRRVSYGGEGGVMKTRQHPQPQTQAKTLSVGQENHRMFGPALVAMAVLLISVLMIFSVLPAMAQAAGYSAEEVQFLELINDYRQQNGLNALLLSDTVEDAARKHNLDMGHYGFFDHTSLQSDYFPEGSAPWDRMEAVGYNYNTYTGENIAAGYETASQVFQGWKNSPGHNANMLKPEYKVIGISREYVPGSPYGYYWNTDFGGHVDPSAHTAGTAGGGGSEPTTTTTTEAPATTTTTNTTEPRPAPTTTTTTEKPQVSPNPNLYFSDVYQGDLFYAAIMSLASADGINGYGDGTFGPGDPVKRAQYAKIISLALNTHTPAIEAAGGGSFKDVPYTGNVYPFDYVEEAVARGIINGYGDGNFGPYDNIPQVQLTLMLVRAGGDRLATPPAGYEHGLGYVPGYAEEAARIAQYNGLFQGTTHMTFDPYQNATRGLVAMMTHNLAVTLGI